MSLTRSIVTSTSLHADGESVPLSIGESLDGRKLQPLALTWYMTEEGRGSMHGCWSGSGNSSSRSTLDRASSKVTVDVMLLERSKKKKRTFKTFYAKMAYALETISAQHFEAIHSVLFEMLMNNHHGILIKYTIKV